MRGLNAPSALGFCGHTLSRGLLSPSSPACRWRGRGRTSASLIPPSTSLAASSDSTLGPVSCTLWLFCRFWGEPSS